MQSNLRSSDYPINQLILNRFSSRAFGKSAITHNQIQTILEAGRFAPSAQNNQPWHFVYVLKNDDLWDTFFDLLAPGNQKWCIDASALAIIVSTDTILYNNQPAPQSTHSLDTGLAVQNILLQASDMQLVAHPMAGFDKQKTSMLLKLPENWHLECMVAFGTKSDIVEELTKRKPLELVSTRGIPNLPKLK